MWIRHDDRAAAERFREPAAVGAVREVGYTTPEAAARLEPGVRQPKAKRRGVERRSQGEKRSRRRCLSERGLGEEDRALRIDGELRLAVGRQRLRLRRQRLLPRAVPCPDRLTARDQSEREEPQRDGGDRHAHTDEHALAARGGDAAGGDVLPLERSGLRLFGGRAREPLLRRGELRTAQQQTPFAPLGVPFERLQEPARVLLRPREVGVECFDDTGDSRVERVAVGEGNPVSNADALGHETVLDRPDQDRHDPLVELERMLDLLLAVARRDRIGADDEDEPVAVLDRRAQRRREHLAVADAVDVDPCLLPPLAERRGEPLHEVGIPAGVRDEDICHQPATLGFGTSVLQTISIASGRD